MWQNSRTRQTQRGARRRNHLGVLVCLMAALFTGVLIGRLGSGSEPTGHIYLNETAPPAAATAGPAPTAAKKAQPQAERIPRHARNKVRRGTATPKPVKSPKGQIPGYYAEDPPARVSGGSGDPVRLLGGMAGEVVSLTNSARSRHGCRPLRVDDDLTRSARTHALEMARTGRLLHNSPDGASPWDRMERAGYRWGAAENIGAGYTSPEEAVRGWLDSRDQRKNILDCGLKAIGVGVASGPNGPWWTQDFGTQ
ncbi:CAP domain-containing protein [Nonomuraea jiangxiensis]|uniref:Cysteine-rich secretory protein family protein n=1 Tax=Nonomuraea jiangxiensis TaxID=633440 RepID=A0A1G8G6Y5_9ACTN|nr:CAP domain-containing protein [Nonomuraea jiangxiensis]SDH90178.1 Cysteine-rich secretory protein family protein [Nonomuraea jiangxiensis]